MFRVLKKEKEGLSFFEAKAEAIRRFGAGTPRFYDFLNGWNCQWASIPERFRTRRKCGRKPFGTGRRNKLYSMRGE